MDSSSSNGFELKRPITSFLDSLSIIKQQLKTFTTRFTLNDDSISEKRFLLDYFPKEWIRIKM